jgi:hypothetical protein
LNPTKTPQAPQTASVKVYNSAGELVATLYQQLSIYEKPTGLSQQIPAFSPDTGGSGVLDLVGPNLPLTWDGKTDSGQVVDGGTYSVVVEVHDQFGNVETWSESLSVLRTDATTVVEVYNSAGELVWRQAATPKSPGVVGLSGRELVPGADPSGLKITYGADPTDFLNWNGTGSQGQALASGTYMVKVTQGGASGSSTSAYAITLLQPNTGLFSWVAVAPNPVRSGTTSLMISLQGAAPGITSWGDVYNLAGERVGSVPATAGPFLNWSIPPGLASGAYLLRLNVRGASGVLRSTSLKVAVIH